MIPYLSLVLYTSLPSHSLVSTAGHLLLFDLNTQEHVTLLSEAVGAYQILFRTALLAVSGSGEVSAAARGSSPPGPGSGPPSLAASPRRVRILNTSTGAVIRDLGFPSKGEDFFS